MMRESCSEFLECRGLDPVPHEAAAGGVLVMFPHAPTGGAGSPAGPVEDAFDRLAREIAACRSKHGPLGLLLVLAPDDRASMRALAGRVEGPFDVIRGDATVDEWHLRTQRLASQVEQLAEIDELRFRATHDDLTGLLRPAEFDTRLREQFSASQRHGHELSLVLIDLDHFGRINKDFDHVTGDRIIARVAAAIRAELRAEDVAGRLGGDEFAVALPFTGPQQAARVVERLRQGIRAVSGPVADSLRSVAVSASLGFESVPGPRLSSLEGLRGHAELALRGAKRAGGDRGVFYRLLDGGCEARAAFDSDSTLSTGC